MIKRIYELTPDITGFLKIHPVKTVATAALLDTYSLIGTVFSLYAQYLDSSPTALIGIYGDGAHIALTNSTDIDEIIEFISFSGIGSVQLNVGDFTLPNRINGFFTKKATLFKMTSLKEVQRNYSIQSTPSLRKLHSLMEEFFTVGERDTFVADMQARINHRTGRAITVKENNLTVASACIFFESEYCGFLGGVCTRQEYRGRGYASVLVSSLCRDLLNQNKIPLISCTNPAAMRIYKALGFEEAGELITFYKE